VALTVVFVTCILEVPGLNPSQDIWLSGLFLRVFVAHAAYVSVVSQIMPQPLIFMRETE
jgi:hypothetical protein